MDWPESLADDLPERRDDEPASLRDDIVDELADHLQCSMLRERHTTRDEAAAREQVLARFGDPSRIARQLWFDSMKGTIMRGRLITGGFVVTSLLLLVCLAGVALLWQRAAAEQQLNRAMIEKLNAMLELNRAEPKSLEWNPLKVRCVLDTPDGKPAVGINVIASGPFLSSSEKAIMTKTTDAEGIADFGLVRPCQAQLDVKTPWREETYRSITISPGQEALETIVYPSTPPKPVEVVYEFEWPKALEGKGLKLVAAFRAAPRQLAGQQWNQLPPPGSPFCITHYVDKSGASPQVGDISSNDARIHLRPGMHIPPTRSQNVFLIPRSSDEPNPPQSAGQPAELQFLGIVQGEAEELFTSNETHEVVSGWTFLAYDADPSRLRDQIEFVGGEPERLRIKPSERLFEQAYIALVNPQNDPHLVLEGAENDAAGPQAAAGSSGEEDTPPTSSETKDKNSH